MQPTLSRFTTTTPNLDDVWNSLTQSEIGYDIDAWKAILTDQPHLLEESWQWVDKNGKVAIHDKTQQPYPGLTLLGRTVRLVNDEHTCDLVDFILQTQPNPERIINQLCSHPKDPCDKDAPLTALEWMLFATVYDIDRLREMEIMLNKIEYLIEKAPLKLSQPNVFAQKWIEVDESLALIGNGRYSRPAIGAFLQQQCLLKASPHLSQQRKQHRL